MGRATFASVQPGQGASAMSVRRRSHSLVTGIALLDPPASRSSSCRRRSARAASTWGGRRRWSGRDGSLLPLSSQRGWSRWCSWRYEANTGPTRCGSGGDEPVGRRSRLRRLPTLTDRIAAASDSCGGSSRRGVRASAGGAIGTQHAGGTLAAGTSARLAPDWRATTRLPWITCPAVLRG
jgi:hypothetical protein